MENYYQQFTNIQLERLVTDGHKLSFSSNLGFVAEEAYIFRC